jgi:hypothetical protein
MECHNVTSITGNYTYSCKGFSKPPLNDSNNAKSLSICSFSISGKLILVKLFYDGYERYYVCWELGFSFLFNKTKMASESLYMLPIASHCFCKQNVFQFLHQKRNLPDILTTLPAWPCVVSVIKSWRWSFWPSHNLIMSLVVLTVTQLQPNYHLTMPFWNTAMTQPPHNHLIAINACRKWVDSTCFFDKTL